VRSSFAILAGAGLAGCALSWAVAQHSLIGARWGFVVVVAVWVTVWIVASRAATRIPVRLSLGALMLLAVALRLAAATGTTPSVSNDLYRYAWDARVQLAGTDPYRYPPDAPQLTRLRPPSGLWPSPPRCLHVRMPPGCTLLNRPQDRTIYPPVAEAWFVAVHLVAPGSEGSRPWQLAGGFVDDVTVVLIAMGLSALGRDPRLVAWYALAPLPVIEFAGNGHVDGLALLLLVAAVLALRRERAGWAGVLVGLATMVKLYPALALMAWWRRGRWRLVLPAVVVAALVEAPHVLVVGSRVLGYVPGYIHEEHYTSGGRFLLLGLLSLPGPLTTVVAAAVVVGVAAAVGRSGHGPAAALAIVLSVLILVTTPVQPWYAAVAGGAGVLAGAPWLLTLGLAAEPYYAAVILADPHQVAVGRIVYGLALAVVLYSTFTWKADRRLSRPRPLAVSGPRT
jgi:hypothetical protein